jgi:hypothetical protein
VLKHRKAAKAWQIRYELVNRLSKIEKFLSNESYKSASDKIYEDEDMLSSKGKR